MILIFENTIEIFLKFPHGNPYIHFIHTITDIIDMNSIALEYLTYHNN